MPAGGFLHANDAPGAYPPSYYAATATPHAPCPSLAGSVQADVCVVGGGYTGLSAALHLAERGFDVVLLEAHRLGWGASGRNGGQLNTGFRRDQPALEALLGQATAQQLWQLAEAAKALVKQLIGRHQIACDLKPGIIDAAHRPRHVEGYRRYVEHLQQAYGYDQIRALDRAALREQLGSPAYHGGCRDDGASHLHPLNYALGLARAAEAAGVRLFEQSEVRRWQVPRACRIETAGGVVEARYLVLACNGYLDGLAPSVARRIMPINNFIIATEPFDEATARGLIRDDVAVTDSRFVVNYFRLSAERRLLFGGGEIYRSHFPHDIAAFVRPRMLQVFPQLAGCRIDYGWGGTLAITMSRLPYLARLAGPVFASAGYSGQGVAIATLAGQVIAEAVAGTAERFDVMAGLPVPKFPGGTRLRWPLQVLAMTYYALRDRL